MSEPNLSAAHLGCKKSHALTKLEHERLTWAMALVLGKVEQVAGLEISVEGSQEEQALSPRGREEHWSYDLQIMALFWSPWDT